LPDDWVTALTIDSSGIKWIGTNNGLARFDGTDWTIFNTSNSEMPSDVVSAITIDDNGSKWIGTYDGGLAVYNENGIPASMTENPDEVSQLTVFPNPAKNHITIESGDLSRNTFLSIFTVNGEKAIERQLSENETQIDISTLPRGVYLVRLQNGLTTRVGKMIRQ
jgi:ligand-binding sensor domain-containing protein